jgi:hypothetical protein
MDRGFSIQPDENIFEDHNINPEEPSPDYLSAQKDIEFFKHSRKFPPEINSIFEHLLRENGLTDAVPVSRDNIQMLPLLVNLLNLSAKEIDPYWYEHKPRMIMFMMGVYPSTFESNGVVYANTPFGQISFHVFNEESIVAQEHSEVGSEQRVNPTDFDSQMKAPELIKVFIEEHIGQNKSDVGR